MRMCPFLLQERQKRYCRSFLDSAQKEADIVNLKEEEKGAEKLHHLVTFHLAREEYGVEIGSVQEIIRATDITPVPGAPSHVKGVINLRGKDNTGCRSPEKVRAPGDR